MAFNMHSMAQPRNNPFSRSASASPSPVNTRPKSVIFSTTSPLSNMSTPPSHTRTQSHTALGGMLAQPGSGPRHMRDRSREGTPTSNTFAPTFIKTEEMRRSVDMVNGIEGENDFSGKRYVWLRDPQTAFVKGWVVEELGGDRLLVRCDDGTVSLLPKSRRAVSDTVAAAAGGRCRKR